MFGVEYILAFVKVAVQVALAIVSAIPFKMAWNAVVPLYFAAYVPSQLHVIQYWHFVGIILISMFLGEVIKRLTPTLFSVNVDQKQGE